jgi:hypothetical protein
MRQRARSGFEALLLAAALGACRRGPPATLPIDDVSRAPEAGPLVFLPSVEVRDPAGRQVRNEHPSAGGFIAPLFVDPDTGAAHRWTQVDPSCASIARTNDDRDGGRSLYSVDAIAGYSPARRLFVAEPSQSPFPDASFVSLSLDGHCVTLLPGRREFSHPTISSDGTTVLRTYVEPGHILHELQPLDGRPARPLAWLKPPDFDPGEIAVRPSPGADRVAVARSQGSPAFAISASFAVDVCDLDGKCKQVMTGERALRDVQWSPDGTRIACLSTWPNDSTSVAIVEVAHPERAPVEVHPGATDEKRSGFAEAMMGTRGGIDAFAWSPDGRRLVLLSSHEGGATPVVRDVGSTEYQALYVVGADGQGLRFVRGGITLAMQVFWVR